MKKFLVLPVIIVVGSSSLYGMRNGLSSNFWQNFTNNAIDKKSKDDNSYFVKNAITNGVAKDGNNYKKDVQSNKGLEKKTTDK